MAGLPLDPDELFISYLPSRLRDVSQRFEGFTSVGSIVFRVGAGEWSVRLVGGQVEVTRGMDDDVMLQVTVPEGDFQALVAEAIERAGATGTLPASGGAPLRALGANPDIARMIRHVPGSVLFVAKDGPVRHRALVTPGRRVANLDVAECTIECALDDLRAAREKGLPPMKLFTTGKLRITGNVQIAMALAGAFT